MFNSQEFTIRSGSFSIISCREIINYVVNFLENLIIISSHNISDFKNLSLNTPKVDERAVPEGVSDNRNDDPSVRDDTLRVRGSVSRIFFVFCFKPVTTIEKSINCS